MFTNASARSSSKYSLVQHAHQQTSPAERDGKDSSYMCPNEADYFQYHSFSLKFLYFRDPEVNQNSGIHTQLQTVALCKTLKSQKNDQGEECYS